MPETINDRQIFSLFEVTRSIQKTIAERYKSSYWIKAELNKLNFYRHSGHCYPELVEKKDGKIIAQIRSTLWKGDYFNINNNFKRVLNEPLKDGIKILFLASINFHPEYGMNLRIVDIDPSFTLGDLEREKQDTIRKLREEGIFNKNKLRKLPILPQRIAIISVETSKGYADFLQVIDLANQSWRYKFFYFLFPSLLQGDKAVPSIIRQLNEIKRVIHHFDAVAIIRGGGGDIGLSCYNNYELAREIALFPIPVLTGIGHATNETVTEMVSFTNAITPTKLAEFLVQKFHDFSVPLQKAQERLTDRSIRLITDERNKFSLEVKLFRSATTGLALRNKTSLNENVKSLVTQSLFIFRNQHQAHKGAVEKISAAAQKFCGSLHQNLQQHEKNINKDVQLLFKNWNSDVQNMEKNINNMKPENVLKRGYSITYLNGKSVSSSEGIKQGDTLTTILKEGSVMSTVKTISK